MASYNKVILMGNLTRDPELKYLPSGAAVANIGLAVNRNVYTDRQTGEKEGRGLFCRSGGFGSTRPKSCERVLYRKADPYIG